MKKVSGHRMFSVIVLVLIFGCVAPVQGGDGWPRMTTSADGVPISYEVFGQGEPTLVFVHGWSCDGRYWRQQVPHFSREHRVIVLDLAGHGHSGVEREEYAMAAFGEDVRAVVEDVGAEEVFLIGHSMGGPVSVAAAHLMPDSVLGIVGVDTFQDVGGGLLSVEEFEAIMSSLREDFRSGARDLVSQMLIEETDVALRDWIISDMSVAPPRVATSAFAELFSDLPGGSGGAFKGLEVPIVAINADLWPTNVEGNRQHMESFEAVIIEGTDHFLHMAEAEDFNRALERVLAGLK